MVVSTALLTGKVHVRATSISCQPQPRIRRHELRPAHAWSVYGIVIQKSKKTANTRQKLLVSAESSGSGEKPCSFVAEGRYDNEMLFLARGAFEEEVSRKKCDDAVSLIKGALLISAEDQAFTSLNAVNLAAWYVSVGDKNKIPYLGARPFMPRPVQKDDAKQIPVGKLSVAKWMEKIDALVVEVEAHLNGDRIRRKPLQILKAVNYVLFDWRFIRTCTSRDPYHSYMDHVLTHGSGSGVLLGIVYMEVCQRLGVRMEGASADDSFLVWPLLGDSVKIIFEPCKGGKSWMLEDFEETRPSTVARRRDSESQDFILDLSVVRTLEAQTNRDILGVILRSLKNTYWKRAAKARPGLTPQSVSEPPLRTKDSSPYSLEELRLAVMAAERLTILNPRDWVAHKELSMLLYHSREYGKALLELSLCRAFCPQHEMESLYPFLHRLYLLYDWSKASCSSICNPSDFV